MYYYIQFFGRRTGNWFTVGAEERSLDAAMTALKTWKDNPAWADLNLTDNEWRVIVYLTPKDLNASQAMERTMN